MKFKSRKDLLFTVVIFSSVFFIFVPVVIQMLEKQIVWWHLIPVFGVLALLLWLYFGTHYALTPHTFSYRSGPFAGTIAISRIRKIVVGETLWSGFKPATAMHGLIVKYGKYEELYISPKTNDHFIRCILAYNKEIVVIDKTKAKKSC